MRTLVMCGLFLAIAACLWCVITRRPILEVDEDDMRAFIRDHLRNPRKRG